MDWLAAREAILIAQRRHDEPPRHPASHRSTAPLAANIPVPGNVEDLAADQASRTGVWEMGFAVDILDLSRSTSEFGRQIHPCKSCVSTSMALCHWPCSCYPNYTLGQTDDWMNEIYPLWVAAHGVMIVTPVNWYHAPPALKAMIDRLVARTGNPILPPPTAKNPKKPRRSS